MGNVPTWAANTMLRIDEKPWGRCYHLSETPHEQIDLCEIVAGGHSSIHLHRHKVNQFVVVSGLLRVREFDNFGNTLREVELERGGNIAIQAGCKHGFLALEDTRLVEVYWRAEGSMEAVRLEDIHRFGENGVDAKVAEEWRLKKMQGA